MDSPIEVAKQLRWQDPSKFSISIMPVGSESSAMLSSITEEQLTSAITGIQLAEINTTPVEEWIAEEWRFATGRLEHYQIDLTLKDYENFTLYRLFSKAIQVFNRVYPDDQKFDIQVKTATDFDIKSYEPIITFKDCMMITVAGPQLDNSANSSIAEFNVIMKASYIETF